MHSLDEIRLNSNITDWNYIKTHLNVSDTCTRPIDFTDFKDKNDYLNGPRFLQAKEINEFIEEEKMYNDPEINLSAHKADDTINDTS